MWLCRKNDTSKAKFWTYWFTKRLNASWLNWSCGLLYSNPEPTPVLYINAFVFQSDKRTQLFYKTLVRIVICLELRRSRGDGVHVWNRKDIRQKSWGRQSNINGNCSSHRTYSISDSFTSRRIWMLIGKSTENNKNTQI